MNVLYTPANRTGYVGLQEQVQILMCPVGILVGCAGRAGRPCGHAAHNPVASSRIHPHTCGSTPIFGGCDLGVCMRKQMHGRMNPWLRAAVNQGAATVVTIKQHTMAGKCDKIMAPTI